VEPGKIYGFLGPNGAGKSTTMNMITGYLGATSGEIKINGHDILKEPEEAKKCIGYLPELPPLYMDMTVKEYLDFVADLKQLEKSVPIMAVGDTFPEEPSGLHTIEPDHYHMGADLAQKLLENYRGNLIGKKIGIYSQHATSEAVIKRMKGICDTLKGSGAEILWSVSKENDSKEKINLQTQRRVDIVMALDNASFVEAGEAAKDNDLYGAVLYGIGNSTEAVYYLDAGWAQCLVAPDEFDAGYESVAELIKKRHNFFYKMKDRQITYTVLTRENLFSEENRNLLFTISR